MTWIATAIIFLLSYLLGSIPTGYLIGRQHGIDIREHGSGNIGATNVLRTLGRKWGIIVFLADMGKGLVAVRLAMWIAPFFSASSTSAEINELSVLTPSIAGILAAIGCIVGHNFPCWLRFKGGKGVATSAGVILGMLPLATLIVAAIWAAMFYFTRYVSLASMVAAVALPMVVFGLMTLGYVTGWAFFYFATAAAFLVLVRHRANITRLLNGTEPRFGEPKELP